MAHISNGTSPHVFAKRGLGECQEAGYQAAPHFIQP
jgi:hypothetical protein